MTKLFAVYEKARQLGALEVPDDKLDRDSISQLLEDALGPRNTGCELFLTDTAEEAIAGREQEKAVAARGPSRGCNKEYQEMVQKRFDAVEAYCLNLGF